MKLKDGQSILFTGDSITDCGRVRPIGLGSGLGNGYVFFVDSMLGAWYPQCRIDVFNTGISGNRVTDLEERWQSDVLNINPDWLSVLIGINDVWRQFGRMNDHNPVTIERYEEVYRKLLEKTRPQLKGLVLMTPFFLEPNLADPMRAKMDAYGGIVKQLSVEFDAVYVDLQAAFDRYLSHQTSHSLCDDRVHINNVGHMIIAKAFLKAIEFAEWFDRP